MSKNKSPIKLKRVPPKLKKLAEKRARLAGELELNLETEKPYIDQHSALLEKLSSIEESLAISAQKRNQIIKALGALDEEIVKLSPKTNPSKIEAIFGWKDRYGKRGALRQYIVDVLTSHHPEYIGFSELADLAAKNFGLTFVSASEKVDWRNENLRGALKELRNQSLIESIISPVKTKGQKKLLWRFKVDIQPTLAELAALDE